MLQLRLSETEQARLIALEPDTPARKTLRLEQIKPLILYGKSHFMLYIP